MATLKGDNRTNADASPAVKLDVRDQHGRMRVARDEITLSAELAAADTIQMMKLPAGAKVYECILDNEAIDSNDVDVGWEAGSSEAADPNGLLDAVDMTSAARTKMSDTQGLPGQYKKFDEEIQITITVNDLSTNGDTKKIQLEVHYVVD
jgi:hypothetical protein